MNIQILRAFAALNVVLYHIIGTSKSYGYETQIIGFLKGWGANGVDIFFVISGFVMLYTSLANKRSVRDFLMSRAIRIIPIYWLLTIVVIALFLFWPSAFREMAITPTWVLTSFAFISNSVTGEHPIVYLGWTLEYEMMFYLVFGFSLWFRSWLVSLSVTTVALVLFAIALSNFILIEFIAGLLIAMVFTRLEVKHLGRTSLIIGSGLLLFSINDGVKDLIDSREILWGIPSVLIVYGAITTTQLNSKIGKLLGDASYSIYLIQVLSIPIFYKVISYIDFGINTDLLAIVCLLSTAIGGTLMYKVVEQPITKYLKTSVFGG
jgi:exopolysaccharide production protein ExoZ